MPASTQGAVALLSPNGIALLKLLRKGKVSTSTKLDGAAFKELDALRLINTVIMRADSWFILNHKGLQAYKEQVG
jgi:hypothetical protein